MLQCGRLSTDARDAAVFQHGDATSQAAAKMFAQGVEIKNHAGL
jgi:hypothetical protein